MNDLFAGCFNEADIKKRYRELCFRFHPDAQGGEANEETMKRVNVQYHERLRGEYRKTMAPDEADERVDMDAMAAEIVAKLVTLPGVIVELVGTWIWVTGDTRTNKDRLKECGLWWAKKKLAWYWHAPEDRCRGGKKTLEEIRAKYGSRKFNAAPSLG